MIHLSEQERLEKITEEIAKFIEEKGVFIYWDNVKEKLYVSDLLLPGPDVEFPDRQ